MFLKCLIIESEKEIIREINFHKGMNLIIDETLSKDIKLTGNNVGKTTVLKLIDFCLGGRAENIYSDSESKKAEDETVKNFLKEKNVLITLILTEDLENKEAKELKIQRNFLTGKNEIRKINDKIVKEKDFESTLNTYLFPNHLQPKPTFRQIISHNIRYKDETINNTLKTLGAYASPVEYETLYLFLLGCEFNEGAKKQEIVLKIKQEKSYLERLEKKQTRNAYEMTLSLVNEEIEELERKKSSFNLNPNFEADLEKLNHIKARINKVSSKIANLKIRKDLIEETKKEMLKNKSDIDLKELKLVYEQASNLVGNLQRTFEELVQYHNNMIIEKVNFITQELPDLETKLEELDQQLKGLLVEERKLTSEIAKSDSFSRLEELIAEINEKYRQKGEYENILMQLLEVEKSIEEKQKELNILNDKLFSNEFEKDLKKQVTVFNRYFSKISEELYGEKYALKYDKITTKKGQTLFQFNSFFANMSSGKKQGEILCFDLAYIIFADSQNIPCLHFLLNDKKELMHDNQLIKVNEFLQNTNIQLVISILKDKLPEELNKEQYFIIKLSQNDKLFRIEKE